MTIKKPKIDEQERRFYKAEVRAAPGGDDDAPTRISGFAAVFNQRSENLGGFYEVIKPGAFDDVMQQDVRGLFNHDPNFVLGRSASGTLSLTLDDIGLHYDIDAPNTQTVRDLVLTPMKRGDIDQSSFTFIVARNGGDHWYEDDEGLIVREIRKFARMIDVGPVSIPAYPDTSSQVSRSLESFKQSLEAPSAEALAAKQNRRQQMRTMGIKPD